MPNTPLTLEKLKIDERLRAVENHISAGNVIFENLTNAIKNLTINLAEQSKEIGKLKNDRAWALGGMAVIIFVIKLSVH